MTFDEDVEPAAMRHAEVDLLDAELAAILDHRFQRRDHAFAAVETEPLGPDIFPGEEFFPLLGVDDLGEDRLLAFGRELDLGVLALHPLLQEAALLDLVDVHIFEADVAAVIGLQHVDDLAHRRRLETERSADPDRPVEVGRRRSHGMSGVRSAGTSRRVSPSGSRSAARWPRTR